MKKDEFNKNQLIAVDFLERSETKKILAEINDAIWSYAELGLEEYNTANLLVNYLEKRRLQGRKGCRRNADCLCGYVC